VLCIEAGDAHLLPDAGEVVEGGPALLEGDGRNRDGQELAVAPDGERPPLPLRPLDGDRIEVVLDGQQVAAPRAVVDDLAGRIAGPAPDAHETIHVPW
jgi:hypothetical protein